MDFERDWRRTLSSELDVVILACKAAWPHLVRRGGGSIINFASANAHVTLNGRRRWPTALAGVGSSR